MIVYSICQLEIIFVAVSKSQFIRLMQTNTGFKLLSPDYTKIPKHAQNAQYNASKYINIHLLVQADGVEIIKNIVIQTFKSHK